MRKSDIDNYIDCEERIWETLRDYLPQEYVDSNLTWIRRQGVEDAWASCIDSPNWILPVVVDGNSIVGMARGQVDWSHLSTLGFLGVDERYRRKGIAADVGNPGWRADQHRCDFRWHRPGSL